MYTHVCKHANKTLVKQKSRKGKILMRESGEM